MHAESSRIMARKFFSAYQSGIPQVHLVVELLFNLAFLGLHHLNLFESDDGEMPNVEIVSVDKFSASNGADPEKNFLRFLL